MWCELSIVHWIEIVHSLKSVIIVRLKLVSSPPDSHAATPDPLLSSVCVLCVCWVRADLKLF